MIGDAYGAAVIRLRQLVRERPRQLAVGAGAAVCVLIGAIGFVSCSGPDEQPLPVAAQPTLFTAPAPQPSGPLFASPTATQVTDGCHGLVAAGQVSQAAGFPVTVAGSDAAATANGYAAAFRSAGTDATVRVCPFTGKGGSQVLVLGVTFVDGGAAAKAYADGQSGSVPVTGVGDAAVTDRATTLMARHGRAIVMVLLVRPDQAGTDQTGPMKAVALAALPRA